MDPRFSLIVGLNEKTALATDLIGKAAVNNVELIFLDNWSDWSISLDCNASRFVLKDLRRAVVVHSRDVQSVSMFGLPGCPQVHEDECAYQEAEFTALLVGMLFALRHPLAERWRYLTSGFSDSELVESELHMHPQFKYLSALRQWGSEVTEALFLRGVWYLHGRDGLLASTDRPSWEALGELASIPVSLIVDRARNTVTPFVGIIPRWPELPQRVIDYILSPHAANTLPRIDVFGFNRKPRRSVVTTIAAHNKDTTARYLLDVSVELKRSFHFIDLTELYSEACLDTDSKLTEIFSAEFLIARPVTLPATGPHGERYSTETATRTLRRVEVNRHFVLGRSSAGFSNNSKPAHMIELTRAGWICPEAIVTNDPEVALNFVENTRSVVFKSCSSVRSIATLYDEGMRDRLIKIKNAPVLFQRRIDGPDCRVHVIAGNVFPLRIRCPDLDYRYSWGSARFDEVRLPDSLTELCIDTGEQLLDEMLGIDLKQDEHSGAWYILEANPWPAFSGFDLKLGGSIARCVFQIADGGWG